MTMDKWITILWTVMLGANLGLTFFIVKWIVREFTSDVKDAVGYDTMGTLRRQQSLLFTKQAILDGQKEIEASLKKYITEQVSEDKTLGSAIKLDGEMYAIVGISKDVEVGEVASANIVLRKIGEDK